MQAHHAIGRVFDHQLHQGTFAAAAQGVLEGLEFAAVNRDLAEARACIGFRITHGADARVREHRRRYELVTHAARRLAGGRAEQMVHQHHRLAQRHRRELHARGYVAQRVDRRHRGLVVFVDHDRAILALHHTPFLEAHIPHVGHAAGGIQHNIHRQQLCLGAVPHHDHLDTAGCLRDPRHVGAQPQIDAGLAQLGGQEVAYIGVESAQYLFTPVQLRHAGAQAVEDGRKLAGDVATAHHQQALGEWLQVEHGVRRDDQLRTYQLGHMRRATGGDQDVFRAPACAIDLHLMAPGEARVCIHYAHAGARQQVPIDAVQPADFALAVSLEGLPVELEGFTLPAESVRLFKRIGVMRGVAVKLLGDTPDVDTGAAQPLGSALLGQRNACAAHCGHTRRAYTAAAAANYE